MSGPKLWPFDAVNVSFLFVALKFWREMMNYIVLNYLFYVWFEHLRKSCFNFQENIQPFYLRKMEKPDVSYVIPVLPIIEVHWPTWRKNTWIKMKKFTLVTFALQLLKWSAILMSISAGFTKLLKKCWKC